LVRTHRSGPGRPSDFAAALRAASARGGCRGAARWRPPPPAAPPPHRRHLPAPPRRPRRLPAASSRRRDGPVGRRCGEGVPGGRPRPRRRTSTVRQIAASSVAASSVACGCGVGNPFGQTRVKNVHPAEGCGLGRTLAPGNRANLAAGQPTARLAFGGFRRRPPGHSSGPPPRASPCSRLSDPPVFRCRSAGPHDVSGHILRPGQPGRDHTFPPFSRPDPPANLYNQHRGTRRPKTVRQQLPSRAGSISRASTRAPRPATTPRRTGGPTLNRRRPGALGGAGKNPGPRPATRITDGYNKRVGPPGQLGWTLRAWRPRLDAVAVQRPPALCGGQRRGSPPATTVSVQPNPLRDPDRLAAGPPAWPSAAGPGACLFVPGSAATVFPAGKGTNDNRRAGTTSQPPARRPAQVMAAMTEIRRPGARPGSCGSSGRPLAADVAWSARAIDGSGALPGWPSKRPLDPHQRHPKSRTAWGGLLRLVRSPPGTRRPRPLMVAAHARRLATLATQIPPEQPPVTGRRCSGRRSRSDILAAEPRLTHAGPGPVRRAGVPAPGRPAGVPARPASNSARVGAPAGEGHGWRSAGGPWVSLCQKAVPVAAGRSTLISCSVLKPAGRPRFPASGASAPPSPQSLIYHSRSVWTGPSPTRGGPGSTRIHGTDSSGLQASSASSTFPTGRTPPRASPNGRRPQAV